MRGFTALASVAEAASRISGTRAGASGSGRLAWEIVGWPEDPTMRQIRGGVQLPRRQKCRVGVEAPLAHAEGDSACGLHDGKCAVYSPTADSKGELYTSSVPPQPGSRLHYWSKAIQDSVP